MTSRRRDLWHCHVRYIPFVAEIYIFSVCLVLLFQHTLPVGPLQEGQKQRMRSGMIPGSWQHRLKLQLFLKASKAYYVLSDTATNLLKYGRALRYIKLSLQCYGKVRTCHYCYILEYICTLMMNQMKRIIPLSPVLLPPDAYCCVSSTLHPQVLQFHCQCLSLCGDIQLMLAQNANNRAAYLEEYSYQTKEDQEILHSLHRESSCQGQYLA